MLKRVRFSWGDCRGFSRDRQSLWGFVLWEDAPAVFADNVWRILDGISGLIARTGELQNMR